MKHHNLLRTAAISALLAGAWGLPAQAVTFHSSDGSITGSLCVGFDCTSSESFGFDTLRLKENNLRMHFQDTSTSASFPTTDWRLTANDSSNGGANHFSIEDASAGRFVFRVFAGARSNALVVDAQGDLGLGTTTPAVDIDIKTGNTPTVRLQQDGTSGFTPQSYDVAGNEANFFIRDVTNGSTLPFRIRPGAPTSALDIAADGDVGLGTASPGQALHIFNAGNTQVLLESSDDNAVQYRLVSDNENRRIVARNGANSATLTQIQMKNSEIILGGPTSPGDDWLTISAAGIVTNGGGGACTVGDPCDAVFDPSVYTVPSIEQHAALMWDKKHLPAVGPTKPGEPINLTLKLTRMLNELEHAHIYIEQLHQRLEDLESRLQ